MACGRGPGWCPGGRRDHRPLNEQEQAACKPTYARLSRSPRATAPAGESSRSRVTTDHDELQGRVQQSACGRSPDGDPAQSSRPVDRSTLQEQAACTPSKHPRSSARTWESWSAAPRRSRSRSTTRPTRTPTTTETKSWDEVAAEPVVTSETRNLIADEQFPCPTYALSVVCTSAGPTTAPGWSTTTPTRPQQSTVWSSLPAEATCST